ncbi:cation:proton antiporter [Nocardia bovistercoris]|uniref:Cation:proton antiporter n=1 Tax=Nocardia bovistercoris TaxID=2785916 RepID=A0A931N5Q8_9NOCA|nr:cation:proton antiporter [Nocardia bovistercoris]MBH0779661.1 cation:proton antiporter [Nocardia bovistercoris]
MTTAVGPLAPIPAHGLLVLLVQLAVLLLFARTFGSLVGRLGWPSVVGELLAGVVLGPSLLPHVLPAVSRWLFPPQAEQLHLLDAIGQVGVLMLVGLAAMQLDLGQVRRRLGSAAVVSLSGLVIPLALGVGAGLFAPTPLRPEHTTPTVFAMFIGIAVCVSAIPVIAKTLTELNLIHRDIGQLIMTAGIIDDTVGWFLLSIVTSLAAHGLSAASVAYSLGSIAAVIVCAVVLGRPVARVVMRRARRTGMNNVLSTVVVLLFAAAAATQSLGMEAVLGAFVCGALLGSSGVELSALAPLNSVVGSVLAPVFFATAGLRMDLSKLVTAPMLIAAAAALAIAIVGKFAGALLGGRLSGLGRTESIALGAGMNARGVIEVVIAMVGLRIGVLGIEAYTILILVAVVTSVMAPPILRRATARMEVSDVEAARARRTAALTGFDPTAPDRHSSVHGASA